VVATDGNAGYGILKEDFLSHDEETTTRNLDTGSVFQLPAEGTAWFHAQSGPAVIRRSRLLHPVVNRAPVNPRPHCAAPFYRRGVVVLHLVDLHRNDDSLSTFMAKRLHILSNVVYFIRRFSGCVL
jgi:hypothetical protein